MKNSVEPFVLSEPINVTQSQPGTVGEINDTIDIRGLASKFWRGKWIIAISLLIAYVIAHLSNSQVIPTYRATAMVMFDIERSNIIESILDEEGFDRSRLADQMLILSSTNLITRVVDQLDLDQDPEFNPVLREYVPSLIERAASYISLPPKVVDIMEDFGFVAPPSPPVADTEARRTAREERLRQVIVRNVLRNLELNPIGNSNVLGISFVSTNRNTASNVANAIANQYIVDQLEAKLEATQAATSWLSVRVDQLRDDVKTAEDKIEAARADLAKEQGQSLEITQQQLGELNASLLQARSDSARLLSDYNRLNNALNEPDRLDTVSEFRASPVISQIRQQETEIAARVATLNASVTQDNPSLVLAKRQLEEIREQVREQVFEEANKIVAAVQNDQIAAKERVAALITQVRALEEKAFAQAADEVAMRQLEREAEASRGLYQIFFSRLQEADVQEDLQSADARILSPAEIPLRAESQQQRRTMLLTMVMGGLIGVGIVFLLDFLNNTFRSPIQLEELSGMTVLGTLPSIGSRTKRQAILDHLRAKPNSSLAESVRNLRTSVLLSNVDNPPKVVMFTSSVPREGKTTSAMLMAMTSRQMGKSAIIVDCDLRMPSLVDMLADVGKQPGLLSVIDGTASIEDAIYEEPTSGVHVLMTRTRERRTSINAADVLSSQRFVHLTKALCNDYDLVILDTPPALVVTDARILSQLADAVVYAVRWNKTPRGAVLEGLKEMQSVGAPIAGLVMTMVNEARAKKYSYDGYNYYKGKYRDYYLN